MSDLSPYTQQSGRPPTDLNFWIRAWLFRGLPHIARGRRAHGHEFFRGGGMQCHGRVEIGLGCFHLDRDADDLRYLGSTIADDVTADDAIGRTIDDQLHQDARVAA
jgi:hypothetical protein